MAKWKKKQEKEVVLEVVDEKLKHHKYQANLKDLDLQEHKGVKVQFKNITFWEEVYYPWITYTLTKKQHKNYLNSKISFKVV